MAVLWLRGKDHRCAYLVDKLLPELPELGSTDELTASLARPIRRLRRLVGGVALNRFWQFTRTYLSASAFPFTFPLPLLRRLGEVMETIPKAKGAQSAKGFSKNPLGPKPLGDYGIDKNLADRRLGEVMDGMPKAKGAAITGFLKNPVVRSPSATMVSTSTFPIWKG